MTSTMQICCYCGQPVYNLSPHIFIGGKLAHMECAFMNNINILTEEDVRRIVRELENAKSS